MALVLEAVLESAFLLEAARESALDLALVSSLEAARESLIRVLRIFSRQ